MLHKKLETSVYPGIPDAKFSADGTRLYYSTSGGPARFEDLFHVLDGRPR